jgi:sec-independent protein translocase protein TatA
MFAEMGIEKLLLVVFVVLLVFGARRMPEIGASMGRGIREFQRSLSGVGDALSQAPEQRERQGTPPAEAEQSGEPHRLGELGSRAAGPHINPGPKRLPG